MVDFTRRNTLGLVAAASLASTSGFSQLKAAKKQVAKTVDLSIDFDLDDYEYRKFLHDETREFFSSKPDIPQGYSPVPDSPRAALTDDGDLAMETTEHPYVVTEVYRLTESGREVGYQEVDIMVQREVKITSSIHVYEREGLSQSIQKRVRDLFTSYSPQAGLSLEQWIQQQLDDDLKAEDFAMRVSLKIQKLSEPQTVETRQRDYLINEYKTNCTREDRRDGRCDPPNIQFWNAEYKFRDFARQRNMELTFVRSYVKKDREEPSDDLTTTQAVYQQGQVPDDRQFNDIISRVAKELSQPDCSTIDQQNFPFLILNVFPEFKICWKQIKIRIGCSTISFSIPIPQVRLATIILYAWVGHPVDLEYFTKQGLLDCLKTSVIVGGVAGLIVGNFAAAVAAAKVAFKSCAQHHVFTCVDIGLFSQKEVTRWVPDSC